MKPRPSKNKKRQSRPFEKTYTNSKWQSITEKWRILWNFYKDISKLRKDFGLKVKKEREARRLSQEELAVKAGVDRTYISQIENGKQSVWLDNIWKLANALKIHLHELMNF